MKTLLCTLAIGCPALFALLGMQDSQPTTKPATPPATAAAAIADPVQAIQKAIAEHVQGGKIDKNQAAWRIAVPKFPIVAFPNDRDYFWHLKTNHGEITVRYLPDVASQHVASSIYLTELGFFDGLKFHRVIPGFMAQGGCPLGNGSGSPGYRFSGEFAPHVKHDRPGLLSMANAGPGTDGSQFFLTFVPTPHLDGKHTIFGEIVDGMAALKELEKRGTSPSGRTLEPLLIEKAWVSSAVRGGKQEAPPETPKEMPKEAPKDAPKDAPKETPKESRS